jgi:SulP family sulfate permease
VANNLFFWDITSVAALDKVVLKFRREGVEVDVINMKKATTTIVDNFGVHHKPEKISQLMGH